MNAELTIQERRTRALATVTAPGRQFELVYEDVRGHRMQVFKNRARSLSEILTASAARGDREYLVCGDLRLTFAEHHDRVASLSRALQEKYGVGKGDRVALLAANSAEWVLSFWAVTALGAIAVGMNSMWSARETADAIELCTPMLVVADEKRRAILDDPKIPVLTIEEDIPRLSLEYSGAELPPAVVEEDDPAIIIFTSGTTGRAKGATHSHRNVIAAADYFAVNDAAAAEMGIPRPEQRRVLLAAPLFHMMSLHNLVVPRLVFGDAVVIYVGRFDIDKALQLVEKEQVTQWGMVPTMANRLVQLEDISGYDLSSLTAISLGSAPSSPSLKTALRKVLPDAAKSLGTTYGLTESSSAATIATAADLALHEDSVGTPVMTMEVKIQEISGSQVADGVEGEICLRGPLVMLGYWNNAVATAAAIDADGWLHTGDIGVMLDGHLRLRSRRSDLIIRGGENIYPAEVEAALTEHPAVQECAVLGAPHEDLGQEVVAVVVTSTDTTEADLKAFMSERIARYKVPTRWVLTQIELPRNATGKIVRRGLEALAPPTA
ncbi:class I adenylate-forming enzyme family protein [Rhodococcus sp. BP22]|uniref:class I adenylate-forming enzyme family protein n=1 Tax=Rhodococcus sp. BP22 TaxID=2758566 RepID=UPI00164787C3|nr:class I adenylate-forming enzyme family protein [Rhodococcus sp. BP22]